MFSGIIILDEDEYLWIAGGTAPDVHRRQHGLWEFVMRV